MNPGYTHYGMYNGYNIGFIKPEYFYFLCSQVSSHLGLPIILGQLKSQDFFHSVEDALPLLRLRQEV